MKIKFFNKDERTDSLSDMELVSRYKTSQQSKYVAILLERYAGNIVAFAIQKYSYEEVSDFSNDLFIKISEKLKRSEITNFKSWLYMLMKNMFVDDYRRSKIFEKYVGNEVAKGFGFIENEGEGNIDKSVIESCLLKIKDPEQYCVRQLFLKERSYKEVMDETDMTFNQIRGARDRGLKLLKEIMYEK